ncbi:MAG: cyclic nucleotide-binding domain-containing protein [Betaproteobacteria bacterium]|nr:MAG: cyclic nucleotide-binding domain-containing protein [Betaproteobacteria bacterium]
MRAHWGDLWGGFAAMLVAVPSAIAFGVTVFAPLGAGFSAQGAVAGMLGAAALGLVAAALGGAPRLISAPCAPAAAVLAAFALEAAQDGASPDSALILLTLVGLLCGALQILFGALGIGRLIKYMPYPVVSGYLSGVALIILASQIPKFLGAAGAASLWGTLTTPSAWAWRAIVLGSVTAAVMTSAPRITKALPGPVLGIAGGVLAYLGLGLADASLWRLEGNPLVVGHLAGAGSGIADALSSRWQAIGQMRPETLSAVLVPSLTLAVLLSIDTLKTCVVVDALTRSRHQSNRELLGQGCGNVAAALVGGMQGAGQMGATLVNLAGGARTRVSGMVEGGLALAAFLLLAPLIAWVPIASLAAILIVIALRMIDWQSLRLLRSPRTALDFVVIAAVIVVAETVGLVAASAVGVGLAVLLFIREQTRGSILHRKSYGNQMFSKQMRLAEEMGILQSHGERAVIFELQGSLFFGTADQLYTLLEPELKTRSYVILDMRRVQSIDVTAAHVLQLMEEALRERKAYLIFSHLPKHVPRGQDMSGYFGEVGLMRPEHHALSFDELDAALEWVENRIIEEARFERVSEKPLELQEIDLFGGRKPETLTALVACMESRSLKDGDTLFRRGDKGDELFLIRKGAVRIMLPIQEEQAHHLATFGRGDFFGEMSFLDREPRSADAIASGDTELYVLPRARFDELASEHKRLALNLLEGLARSLAVRLRYTNTELRLLQAA